MGRWRSDDVYRQSHLLLGASLEAQSDIANATGTRELTEWISIIPIPLAQVVL